MSRFSQWAKKEHPLTYRIAATLLAGTIFVGLIPLTILRLAPHLDARLALPTVTRGPITYVVGGALSAVGIFFALWSILAQLTRGRGTPLPMMATQELLTTGPFRLCRNPMSFGTLSFYLGLGLIRGTVAGIAIVVLLGTSLILYLKTIEERELLERFGDAYLTYRREVPFIVPRLPE